MSLLVAISLVAGMGHAASAAAPASLIDHQHAPEMSMSPMMETGHMMHGPAQQPASPHHHHGLTGCACCAMACCAAVLPPMALVSRAVQRISVVYASFLASGRGIGAVLEPDPPRPLTL
jgi:hypothetical protein